MEENKEPSLEPSYRGMGPNLEVAKKSHKMLIDFKEAIERASFHGKESAVIAMGLNFLENMISQSMAQIAEIKRAEKEVQEAMKSNGVSHAV